MALDEKNWFHLNQFVKVEFETFLENCSPNIIIQILVRLEEKATTSSILNQDDDNPFLDGDLYNFRKMYEQPKEKMRILEMNKNQVDEARLIIRFCVWKCVKDRLEYIKTGAPDTTQTSALEECQEKLVIVHNSLMQQAKHSQTQVPPEFFQVLHKKQLDLIRMTRRALHAVPIMAMVLLALSSPATNLSDETKKTIDEYCSMLMNLMRIYLCVSVPIIAISGLFGWFGMMLWRRSKAETPPNPIAAYAAEKLV